MADQTPDEKSQEEINTPSKEVEVFPNPSEVQRLKDYKYNKRLFMGDHFEAFSMKIGNNDYNANYSRLRYVMANFAGLISKVMADMIFGEPPDITIPDGDSDFLETLIRENKLRTQNYEQALSSSYRGDCLYKLRVDKRRPNDTNSTVIIEPVTPAIYFPRLDPFNITGKPTAEELCWVIKKSDDERYVRKEIHTPGMILNELWELDKEGRLIRQASFSKVGMEDVPAVEDTGVNRSLLVHMPNWKDSSRYFGISDYYDLESLFYAINNRMTKTDNILDKHSDPILALPEGILDEKGKLKKGSLNLIQRPEGAGKEVDPNYITWDASLENAFKEVEKLVEFLFMMAEVSPDILGMGQGQSDSGRALKLKILRTVAKARRKELYFDEGLKEVLYVAQLLAQAHGLQADEGVMLKKDPKVPEVKWNDGIPPDYSEQVDVESKRVDAGLTTKKNAIIRIDGVDDKTAEKEVKAISEEDKVDLPTGGGFGGNPFTKKPMPMDQNQNPTVGSDGKPLPEEKK